MEALTTEVAVRPAPSTLERGRVLRLMVALGLGAALYGGLFWLGGEGQRVALAGLQSVPFVVLALFAYTSTAYRWVRWLTILWLVVLTWGYAFLALGQAFAVLTGQGMGQLEAVQRVFPWLALAVLVGWLMYLAPARRLAARWLPLDPGSFVHATALAVAVALILVSVVPLATLGAPPLLLLVQAGGAGQFVGDRSTEGQLLDQVYGLAWLVPATVFAVGFPLVRDLRTALVRLGLVRPTAAQVRLGVALALLLVLTMTFAVGTAIDAIWQAQGWPKTDAASFSQLVAYALSPLGALVVGISAGLGEELAVRGVLQPRLGILLSNLFFTALHAFQYGPDSLLTVFLLGLILGRLRQATNTTTAAIAHGLYDCCLILATVLHAPGFS